MPPESKYSNDDLPSLAKRTCEVLFGSNLLTNTTISTAILVSFQPLVLGIERQSISSILERLCYSLAWKKNDLLIGKPVQVWTGQACYEWALQQVISVEDTDLNLPIALRSCMVRTRVLTGQACGVVCSRLFTRRSLVFLAPKMGFAKKLSDKQMGIIIPKHPRFLDSQDLLGIRWLGLMEPNSEYPPRYFEIACRPSIMDRNRELIRSRRHDSRTKTGRQQPLVQSAAGPGLTNGSNSPPGV